MSSTDTPKPRPAATDNAWFVVDLQTETTVCGPTTKRKADNHWKKLVNFGNPDREAMARFRTSVWNPEALFHNERMAADIAANGLNASPEALAWANRRARR